MSSSCRPKVHKRGLSAPRFYPLSMTLD
jgi:hypothetical protein